MRVMITGAEGQLGRDVVDACSAAGHDAIGLGRAGLDLVDPTSPDAVVGSARPDVVVNCAAMTAVDLCETEIELAHEVNENGVRRLAEACSRHGAHLVHVSTDYVFDGTLDRAYVETDETNPRSVYGRSKLAGELAATDVLGDAATIVRTSWVCGEHGNNMVGLVRRLAPNGTPLAFVDDQRGCPTFTADLAIALIDLAERRDGAIFHVTNAGAVSWFEFVGEILEASGYDRSLVNPISTEELQPPRPAPRPANSVLANDRWTSTGREPLRDFRLPLVELCARLDAR